MNTESAMTTNHTPTPWRLAEGREQGDTTRQFIWPDAPEGEVTPRDDSPFCIATVNPRQKIAVMKANAAFIVTACNAHDELIEALGVTFETLRQCASASSFAEFIEANPKVTALVKVTP